MKILTLFRRTTEPFSRSEYAIVMAIYWLYTLIWIGIALFIVAGWTASVTAKVLVGLLWLTLFPSGGQFQTYRQYRDWHAKRVRPLDALKNGADDRSADS